MAHHVCPFWIGYLLISPVRKLFEDPYKMLGNFVREGMTVLEPGSGMGYFTIPLAHLVGPSGRVIAVDIKPKMIAVLEKRASKAGMINRIERRLCRPERLNVEDLREGVDLAVAIHMLHETQEPGKFLDELRQTLKKDGTLLVMEPRGHVSKRDFENSVALARAHGLTPDRQLFDLKGRKVLLRKR